VPKEQMTQDEIDKLLNSLNSSELEIVTDNLYESPLNPDEVKYKYNAIAACKTRYEYALMNKLFDDIKEAAKNLHYAGFSNWLFKHGLDREGYYKLMNREAQKRGLRPPFLRFFGKQ